MPPDASGPTEAGPAQPVTETEDYRPEHLRPPEPEDGETPANRKPGHSSRHFSNDFRSLVTIAQARAEVVTRGQP